MSHASAAGGKIFTGIAKSIADIFCDVVNGIITGINTVIAVPFDGINWALGKIKKVSVVGVKPFKWIKLLPVPQIPLLAEGGVVDEATPAVFGEDGAEAVVPLEKNTGWIRKVAQDLHSLMIDPHQDNSALYGYHAQAKDERIVSAIRSDIEAVKDAMTGVLDILGVCLPEIQERMEHPIPAVVGVDQAADALAEPINYRIGRIAVQKGRGR